MPIRPELRQYYGREWRRKVRMRALTDSCGFCAHCGMPGRDWRLDLMGRPLAVIVTADGRWFDETLQVWRDRSGRVCGAPKVGWRRIAPQLGCCHADGNPQNNDPANIRIWCRGCHLRADGPTVHKRTREANKDKRRPLLAGLLSTAEPLNDARVSR